MHTQHLRQKLDRIERDSGLDGQELPPLTLTDILTSEIEYVNENVCRVVESNELKRR